MEQGVRTDQGRMQLRVRLGRHRHSPSRVDVADVSAGAVDTDGAGGREGVSGRPVQRAVCGQSADTTAGSIRLRALNRMPNH